MRPIDQPFRFTLDFYAVWALLTLAAIPLASLWDIGPWYSRVAFTLVTPFIGTFFVYGPVLLIRQAIHSGSRGWFVIRALFLSLLGTGLLLGALYFSGLYTEKWARALVWVGLPVIFACFMLPGSKQK